MHSAPVRRALVVDEDGATRELLRAHLQAVGFTVERASNGLQGLERGRAARFDLITLDAALSGVDGITLCRALRNDEPNRQAPILFISGRRTEADAVVGLDSGADGYLTKPFGIGELMAIVGALLRRCARNRRMQSSRGGRVVARDLALDLDRREAMVRGTVAALTKQEFDLLHHLAARPGIVFSREALLRTVWKEEAIVTDRTVDTVISRLRRKIETDPQNLELLVTAWGVGYKFADVD